MKIPSRFLPIAVMVLFPAVFRTAPYVLSKFGLGDVHDPALFLLTFSPVGAVFLFGGATFAEKRWAYLAPLLTMLLSDLAIGLLLKDLSMGFHLGIPAIYGSYALMIWLGTLLARVRSNVTSASSWFQCGAPSRRWLAGLLLAVATAGAALAGEGVFFIVTNFATWVIQDGYYPHTAAGLMQCYIAGVPFFRSLLTGMAVYGTALFGGLAAIELGMAHFKKPALLPDSNQPSAA
jgi:hypothetical protein